MQNKQVPHPRVAIKIGKGYLSCGGPPEEQGSTPGSPNPAPALGRRPHDIWLWKQAESAPPGDGGCWRSRRPLEGPARRLAPSETHGSGLWCRGSSWSSARNNQGGAELTPGQWPEGQRSGQLSLGTEALAGTGVPLLSLPQPCWHVQVPNLSSALTWLTPSHPTQGPPPPRVTSGGFSTQVACLS